MILVIAEQSSGVLNRASWEAIAAAQSMGGDVKVAVAGADPDAPAGELAAAEVAEVVKLQHEALGTYTPDAFVMAYAALIQAESPSHVVFPHTYQTRDYAPRLAARLGKPLVTDCTAVKPHEGGHAFSRPMFQGKVAADVVLQGGAPHFVTFQIGAFRGDAVKKGSLPVTVRPVTAEIDVSKILQQAEEPFREAKQAVDLSQAERIVSIGRGIKSEDKIALAKELAEALGAEIAASRPICDSGWLPMERQIGSSGQTVAPKLYLALGISGAIQHVVGMKGAKTIVAINKDAEAPIFEVADYGIVGDLFEVVPAMIEALKS